MLDQLRDLFQIDWHIFMAATQLWRQGGNPYALGPEFGPPGAFAYPPTALSWLALFLPFGAASFWLFSGLQILCWTLLLPRGERGHLILLFWSPFMVHFLLGQSTLATVLALWAVYRAPHRGWLCGFILAFAATKPQTALFPMLWLLWHERNSPTRGALWGGLVLGTVLLALPPTLRDPGIWREWLGAMADYRLRQQVSAAWQGIGPLLLLPAAWLWWRYPPQKSGNAPDSVWPWWLTAAFFPQGTIYPAVVMFPVLRPRGNYWTIAGLGLSSLLVSPTTGFTLPIFLSGHLLAGWMINGGPAPFTTTEKRNSQEHSPS